MKTFRLLTSAAIAVLMCYFFASCSKDGSNVKFSKQKRISELKLSYDNEEPDIFSLQYDERDRLIKVTLVDENGMAIEEYASFVWGDDVIERTDDWPYTMYLENGLMQTRTTGYKFTYNKSNRLAKMEINSGGLSINEYIWDADKLIRITSDSGYTQEITYKEKCKKGYYPIMGIEIDYENYFLSLAHPELIGVRTTQLPTMVKYGNTEYYIDTYSYEFDAEGYVSKVVVSDSDGYTETYALTWE